MSERRKQTAQQKLNNFLRSDLAKTYPLCATKKLILHALASYCYYKDECDPSLAAIAEYCCLKDIEKMSIHLHELMGLCLIKITERKGRRNLYLWLVPHIPDEEIYRKKGVDKSKISCVKVKKDEKPPRSKRGSNPPAQRGVVH